MMNICKRLASGAALSLALTSPAAFAKAGPVSFGIKGGVGMSKIGFPGATNGLGFLGGAGVDVGAGVIGAQVDAFYAIRKTKVGSFTQGGVTIADAHFTTNQVFVPVQLRFSVAPMLKLTAGGYFAMGIGKVSYGAEALPAGVTIPAQDYADVGMSKTDFGAIGGLAVNVGPILIGGHYFYGLKNLSTETGVTAKNQGFDALVGFVF